MIAQEQTAFLWAFTVCAWWSSCSLLFLTSWGCLSEECDMVAISPWGEKAFVIQFCSRKGERNYPKMEEIVGTMCLLLQYIFSFYLMLACYGLVMFSCTINVLGRLRALGKLKMPIGILMWLSSGFAKSISECITWKRRKAEIAIKFVL